MTGCANVDLGTCPFVVHDDDTAKEAGRWAQERAVEKLKKVLVLPDFIVDSVRTLTESS